jgi:ABC-type branched-subunit amino acid transport system substrate-binding protein
MAPRVYVSLPLSGRFAAAGHDVLRGAQLALEAAGGDLAELVVLDSAPDDRDDSAEANAHAAAADPRALAYLGDHHSSQVERTAPALAVAGMLAVAPVATKTGLAAATLVRLTPDDAAGAAAAAEWMADRGVEEVLVVHDHDGDYGSPVGAMTAAAARERGLRVRARPVWDHDEPPAADLGGANAVLYVGVAGSGAAGLWRALHAADPELWLLGSDGVARRWLAREMDAGAAARTRFFVGARAPLAFYGHAAMAHVLDALAAGGGDRAAVAAAGRDTRERACAVGRYALDADGLTTLPYGRMAVVSGALVWD